MPRGKSKSRYRPAPGQTGLFGPGFDGPRVAGTTNITRDTVGDREAPAGTAAAADTAVVTPGEVSVSPGASIQAEGAVGLPASPAGMPSGPEGGEGGTDGQAIREDESVQVDQAIGGNTTPEPSRREGRQFDRSGRPGDGGFLGGQDEGQSPADSRGDGSTDAYALTGEADYASRPSTRSGKGRKAPETRQGRAGDGEPVNFHVDVPRLTSVQWDALFKRVRNPTAWTDDELRGITTFCPACNRVVFRVVPGYLGDPPPKYRSRIVAMLGGKFTSFGIRSPMRSHEGERVREAHECSVATARQRLDEKGNLTWEPKKLHEMYDEGI